MRDQWQLQMLDFYSFWHTLQLIWYSLQLITLITYTPAAKRIWMPMTVAPSIHSARLPLLLPFCPNCHAWTPACPLPSADLHAFILWKKQAQTLDCIILEPLTYLLPMKTHKLRERQYIQAHTTWSIIPSPHF
jgi:hypothetical protein